MQKEKADYRCGFGNRFNTPRNTTLAGELPRRRAMAGGDRPLRTVVLEVSGNMGRERLNMNDVMGKIFLKYICYFPQLR